MKIEKLTENKIRIIINSSDLETKSLNIHLLMTRALDRQEFFSEMLERAKDEVGFDADGCKLLIETLSTSEDILVVTVTKYALENMEASFDIPKKKLKLTPKRKLPTPPSKHAIYRFNSFEEFCNFCQSIDNNSQFEIKKFSKNISLHLYNNTYYLLLKGINLDYDLVNYFSSLASEFSTHLTYSPIFENKLVEYGKPIMKRNAIITGIKYFGERKEF